MWGRRSNPWLCDFSIRSAMVGNRHMSDSKAYSRHSDCLVRLDARGSVYIESRRVYREPSRSTLNLTTTNNCPSLRTLRGLEFGKIGAHLVICTAHLISFADGVSACFQLKSFIPNPVQLYKPPRMAFLLPLFYISRAKDLFPCPLTISKHSTPWLDISFLLP